MIHFNDIAIHPCDILLPQNTANYEKWAVIACDQYTSQPEYWEKVAAFTKGTPSALDIILPEVYLEDGDENPKIHAINQNMEQYLQSGFFQTLHNSMILINRTLSGGTSRKGLIAAVDLECYDYRPDAASLIRATEGTVLERIPPRVKIREQAPLELPHIMLLIDDPKKTVIEPLFDKTHPQIYDFDLMMQGGHITGYQISDPTCFQSIHTALAALCKGATPLLYAVGDGNHSLASAKAHWENVKTALSPAQQEDHPARYALAELINLHDESLVFEPIHRICTGISPEQLLVDFLTYFQQKPASDSSHVLQYIYHGQEGKISIPNCTHELEIGTLQEFLSYYEQQTKVKVDYIHGEEVLRELASNPDSIGFLLPAMHKDKLFPSVANSGVLPRKTFSMGEADEKRFYLECRKIIK